MAIMMLFITFVPVVLISVFIPYLTRRTESFGVSIPEDIYESEELVRMRKSYAFQCSWLGVVAIATSTAMMATLNEPWASISFSVFLLLFLVISFFLYLKFHFRMKALKQERNWKEARSETLAIDTSFRRKKVAYSNWWFVIHGLAIVGTVIMTFAFYDRIPNRIPTNFDFEGNVTGWTDKSTRALLMLPALQVFMTGLFIFINTIISRSKQQIDAANPEASVQRNIVFRRRWSAFSIVMGAVIIVQFFASQLSYIINLGPTFLLVVNIVGIGAILVGCIVLSFTTGQGGSRVKTVLGKQDKVINRDDDRHWKLGQFYFNPDDPAIWIEKRFGVGWTINFARPLGWGSLLAILGLALLLPILFS